MQNIWFYMYIYRVAQRTWSEIKCRPNKKWKPKNETLFRHRFATLGNKLHIQLKDICSTVPQWWKCSATSSSHQLLALIAMSCMKKARSCMVQSSIHSNAGLLLCISSEDVNCALQYPKWYRYFGKKKKKKDSILFHHKFSSNYL